jgi:hypothetical protein
MATALLTLALLALVLRAPEFAPAAICASASAKALASATDARASTQADQSRASSIAARGMKPKARNRVA